MSTDIAILRRDEWLFSLGGTRHARMCAGTSKSFKSENWCLKIWRPRLEAWRGTKSCRSCDKVKYENFTRKNILHQVHYRFMSFVLGAVRLTMSAFRKETHAPKAESS